MGELVGAAEAALCEQVGKGEGRGRAIGDEHSLPLICFLVILRFCSAYQLKEASTSSGVSGFPIIGAFLSIAES